MSLPEPVNDQELEAMLTETFGPPPGGDIDAWRKRYPAALAWLNPERISIVPQRRKRMRRITVLAATTAAVVCVWLGMSHFDGNGLGTMAYADVLAQIEKAKTITSKRTVYIYDMRGKCKDPKWAKVLTQDCVYKSPGLEHVVQRNESGPMFISVTDHVHGKTLSLDPETKRATLDELPASWRHSDSHFDWYREKLKDASLQWVEKRKTASGEVNVFRYPYKNEGDGSDWSFDFWVDARTKRLIEVHSPGADIYDLKKVPTPNASTGKGLATDFAQIEIYDDFVLDAVVDDSLFSLDSPEGYTLQSRPLPKFSEQEMVEYLGILADFNDRTFPNRAVHFCESFNSKAFRLLEKPSENLSAAEKKYLKAREDYAKKMGREVTIPEFIDQIAVEKSFRYFGKGVKLGNKQAIVCWYKLKDAKDPNMYRVVYGDLSVTDVAARDLPLPVEP